MTFYLEEEIEVKFEFHYRELAEKIILFCLEYCSFPFDAEVNLTLTNNEGIQQLNEEFRQIERPTDVLSFPMLSYETPGEFDFLNEENSNDFNPETGEAILGDIVISVDKVVEQAENFGHSIEREFAFLITHSMLHLFGYDHIDVEEAKIMENLQKDILQQMNILR